MMIPMIVLTLASHPIHILLAVVALYHAAKELLGRRNRDRRRAPKGIVKTIFRSAA